MTPFDARQLMAMLAVFYPTVSPAALSIARRERPEYFSGGRLAGPFSDELVLPDGRRFACIDYAGPAPVRWQVRACPTPSISSPGH